MSDEFSHLPDGYHSLTPYLIFKNAAKAIEFYKDVFGATEDMRFEIPGGGVGHAELQIGNSKIMVADECPDVKALSPGTVGGTATSLCLYVADADTIFEKAVAAGAEVIKPIADQFYGDRSGSFYDPFGHMWTVATRKENLTFEEMQQRAADMMKQHGGAPDSAE